MGLKALEDFNFYSAVSDEILKKYQDLIPAELTEVWKEYGFGSFYNGYLKTINPDEYMDIFNDSCFAGSDSIPIFTTGFGDIIAWQINRYVLLIEYRKNDATTLSAGFKFFFDDLTIEGSPLIKKLDKGLYDKALSVHGSLEYDECFGFFPLLVLGGGEKAINLKKVKIIPHIDLITQSAGRIE